MQATPYEYILSNKAHTNYLIRDDYLHHLFNRYIKYIFQYDDITEFLDIYRPELEGEIIYLIAKEQREILEEE